MTDEERLNEVKQELENHHQRLFEEAEKPPIEAKERDRRLIDLLKETIRNIEAIVSGRFSRSY